MRINLASVNRHLDEYEKHPLLFQARNIHINHRGSNLDIPDGSYLKDIYTDKSRYIAVKKSTQCLLPDAYVTTANGVKKISEICVGETVLSHTGCFNRVTEVHCNDYSGFMDLYKISGTGKLQVTGEHPLYVSKYHGKKYHYSKYDKIEYPEWIESNNVIPGWYVYRDTYPLKGEIKSIKLSDYCEGTVSAGVLKIHYSQKYVKNKIKLNESFGRLVGYFIAEGWTRKHTTYKKSTEIGFAFNNNETEYIGDVVDLIIKITGESPYVKRSNKDNCTRIMLRNKALYNFFSMECGQGSGNKSIPEFTYRSTKEFAKGVIIGMYRGDGTLNRRQIIYTTKSILLSRQIIVLLSAFNIHASCIKEKKAYRVSVSGANENILRNILNIDLCGSKYSCEVVKWDYCLKRIRSKSRVFYKGKVYNLTVENDNSYIADNIIVHNCGVSELLTVRAFYRAETGHNIFYVFPTYDLKNQFVRERIDKTLLYTRYYRELLESSEAKQAESMSLKQIGAGTIAFVGSNTKNAFLSFSADDVIIDETDNCHQENLIMAEERQSASRDKNTIKVGNPTVVGFGIDAEYKNSDQKEWHIFCNRCRKYIKPEFFGQIVEKLDNNWVVCDPDWEEGKDPNPICPHCRRAYNRYASGRWVKKSESTISGYQISKMFSTQVTTGEMLKRFSDGLYNDMIMQRFYNGDLGMAYTSAGAKIDAEMLDDCLGDYFNDSPAEGGTIAGIDVGKVYNVIIASDNRVVYIGAVRETVDLLHLLKRYKVSCFVIDSRPETREAMKICQIAIQFGAVGVLCDYTTNKKDLQFSSNNNLMSIDRTMSIDSLKEQIVLKKILLPQNARDIEGFYPQMTAPTRIYNEKADRYDWVESAPDHFFHGMNYLFLAKRLLPLIRR